MKKHPRLTAMYCPDCGQESLLPEPARWPYVCHYCGEDMRYLRLPRVVLRKRTKEAARNCNSKAAKG